MQLKSISLAALIALFASSATSFTSNLPMLSPVTRVLAQSTETNKSEAARLLDLCREDIKKNQFQAALQSCQQAVTTAQTMGDRSTQAKSLNILGNAYLNTGNVKQALTNYQQALPIAQAIKDRVLESKVLLNLGEAANKLGDTAKAKALFQQALAIAQEIKDAQLVSAAKAQIQKPEKVEADKLLEQGNKQLDTSQFQAALRSYQQALKIYQSIQDREGEAHSLGNLGLAYYNLGDYKRAIDYYNQSLTIASAIGDLLGEAISLGNLGPAYDNLGDYKRAIDYQIQSLTIARAIGDRLGEAKSLNNLGVALLDSGNPKAAEENLRNAIAVHECMRKDLGSNDAFKISIFETQASSYRLLQQALVAQNQTTEALLVAEGGRNKAFIELLAQRQQLSSAPVQLSIAQIRQIAKQQHATLVEYSIALNNLYIWVIKPTTEVTFHKVDIKKTNLGNAAEDTRVAASNVAEGRGVAHDVITSLVGKTRSTLNSTIDSASSSDTTAKVHSLSCRGNNCLQQMYQLLIQPIAKELPTNPDAQVIFIPHESLFLVPFAALQDENHKFLIEKHTISIAPSIQVLELIHQNQLKLHSQQSASQNSVVGVNRSALVVGNPTMPQVATKIGEPPQQLPALPGAEREAQSIAQVLKTQPLTGEQATKVAVKKLMERARIIHLATHGLLDNLAEAGIPGVVALAPSKGDDGLLSANEVLDLKLNAELVVLSACDTGRGRITGDGAIGFPRALIAAGVPSIIVSLWQVSDLDSTVFLMPEFYRQLQHNSDKAHALRQAMLATMKKYPNPSDWAAFILIGEAD